MGSEFMIDRWVAEATECDFKVALEAKKPKSWLKSVSAFSNGRLAFSFPIAI